MIVQRAPETWQKDFRHQHAQRSAVEARAACPQIIGLVRCRQPGTRVVTHFNGLAGEGAVAEQQLAQRTAAQLVQCRPSPCKALRAATLRANTQGRPCPRKYTSRTQPILAGGRSRAAHSSSRNGCQPSNSGVTLKASLDSHVSRRVSEPSSNSQLRVKGVGKGLRRLWVSHWQASGRAIECGTVSQYWQQKRRRAYHGTLNFCRAKPAVCVERACICRPRSVQNALSRAATLDPSTAGQHA